MIRRDFIRTVAALGTSASSSSEPAEHRAALTSIPDEPHVFVREDFHHLSGLAPPLTLADITKTVDLLVGTSVDTLIFSLGSTGGMCLYDTRVGQMHGTNVGKWTHAVNYRDGRYVRQLVANGWDRPQLFCDRCHETGLLFFASAPLTIGAHTTPQLRGLGRTSDFVFDNAQLQVGPDADPRGRLSPTRLSFMFPEVRQERIRIYEEFLSRYETDGVEVEVNWLPLCKYSQIRQCAPLLMQWFRDLRQLAQKAQQAQHRRKRIYVQLPASPATWQQAGLEVGTWIAERLVDGLICTANDPEVLDQDLDLSEAVSLCRGTPCRILVGCGPSLGKIRAKKATTKMLWAAAANAYQQQAAGFGLNDMIRSQELSFLGNMVHALRPLRRPQLLETVDKLYRVRDQPTNPQTAGTGLPGTEPLLPKVLEQGQPQEVPLRIADDLHRWHALGRVKRVRLRVRISNLEPSLNELRIELNGRLLPDSLLQIHDLNYRFIREGVAYQGSQIYEYALRPEVYPQMGRNIVKVTLIRRDPDVDLRCEIQDVDCLIEYRLHRHFEDGPTTY